MIRPFRMLFIALAVAGLGVFGGAVAQDVLNPQSPQLGAEIVEPIHYEISVTPNTQALTTTASVVIDINVKKPTKEITLNAFQMAFDKVVLDNGGAAPVVTTSVAGQTATFAFPENISVGRHRLAIDYRGRIGTGNAYGLFAVDYKNPEGQPERMLATQFETTAARRFVPCWDDPAVKATFSLTMTTPSNRMVVSNTPVARTADVAGGLRRTTFERTPKMSSYLLFVAVGDMERIHKNVNGVDVGVVLRRGMIEQGRFALGAAEELLNYYNSYFGIKYPLPKMDMIGIPPISSGFSAMENWGAISYLESAILVDQARPSETQRQLVFKVVAHEMAHQWFGDLVTMKSWNELWLNEGFATWMASKAADFLHPDWQTWVQELGDRESAMSVDMRATAPAIVRRPGGPPVPPQITYQKGEYVVRMIEAYLGNDKFRDGIRRYMKAHAYANTTGDDLWAALKVASGVDVTTIAHHFTEQGGIPLIKVETRPGGGVRLTQERFGADSAARAARTWQTPVINGVAGSRTVTRHEVTAGKPLDIAGAGPHVVNAGQIAYLRVDYDDASFAALRANFGKLDPIDQVGVLNDQFALANAGLRPMSNFLSLIRQVPPTASPVVWLRVVSALESFDNAYVEGPDLLVYRAAAKAVLDPVVARVGAVAKPGEPVNTETLRGRLNRVMTRFGGPRQTVPRVGSPTAAAPVMLDANTLDAATYDELLRMAKSPPPDLGLPPQLIYIILGQATDPDLARRSLELATGTELPQATRANLFRGVTTAHPKLAWEFMKTHPDEVNRLLGTQKLSGALQQVVGSWSDPALATEAAAYITMAEGSVPPSLQAALNLVGPRAEARRTRTAPTDAWARERPNR